MLKDIPNLPALFYFKVFKKDKFVFNGEEYNYFYHLHNRTWKSERCVEIPIFIRLVKEEKGDILEVGNTLQNYFWSDCDIVDKYEKGENVITKDILDFNPNKKYDLIMSISTIEHIGNDKQNKDPDKWKRVIEYLKTLLKDKGKLVFSFSIGWNKGLDESIEKNDLGINFKGLKRILRNEWVETDIKEILGSKIDKPFPSGNGLVIAEAIRSKFPSKMVKKANSKEKINNEAYLI